MRLRSLVFALERAAERLLEALLGAGPPPPRIGLVCAAQPAREAVSPEEGTELDRRFWAIVADATSSPYDWQLEDR